MQVFKVGGCVRDMLLGVESNDIDYVVVNATQDDMLNAGFSQVGKDFPVFLHPETGDEYALARTERKVGQGYTAFEFSTENVSLEDDLKRRDFTFNSMALAGDQIIDPFNGQEDLKNKIVRHTSEAFAEDPVRIFRGARFAGRYGFVVAEETLMLMKQLVDNDEVEAMTKDRIFVELQKLIIVKHFVHAVGILEQVGVIDRVFGQVDWESLHKLEKVDTENKALFRMAILAKNQDQAFMQNHKFTSDMMEFILTWKKVQTQLAQFDSLNATELCILFEKADLFRKPERFKQMLEFTNILTGSHFTVDKFIKAIRQLDMTSICDQCADKKQIASVVRQARTKAIQSVL